MENSQTRNLKQLRREQPLARVHQKDGVCCSQVMKVRNNADKGETVSYHKESEDMLLSIRRKTV